jgi:Protein of unknown function (DUF4012)
MLFTDLISNNLLQARKFCYNVYMSRPQLVVSENSNLPILIIDREGSIGIGLYARLKDHLQIVLVGGREPQVSHNLVFLPLHQQIPTIPKDTYSHIFLIAQEEKDVMDLLPSCAEKAKNDNAKLIIGFVSDSVRHELIMHIFSSYEHVVVVLIKDIFGSPIESHMPNYIEKLFYQAKRKGAIQLSHMGLRKLYPIQYEDVIVELLKLAFGASQTRAFFYLFCKFPVTELGLAHALQKSDPLLKIDFTDGGKSGGEIVPEGGIFLLPETYPVLKKLYAAYTAYTVGKEKKEEVGSFPKQQEQEAARAEEKFLTIKQTENKLLYPILFCLIFLVIFASLPALSTTYLGFQAKQLLLQSKNSLEKGDTKNAKKSAVAAYTTLELTKKTASVLLWETNAIGLTQVASSVEDPLQTGTILATEMQRVANTIELTKNVIAGYTLHPAEDIHTVTSNMKHILFTAQNMMQDPAIPISLKQQLGKQLDATATFSNVIDGLPAFLSVDGKKTYAVLFQNNMELRPGGGFIGSYGLLTLDKGKIVDFTIHDVYDADGQLKGHIEPPFPIRRYLPSAHWYLRDSNFDVDFLKNASQVAFFLQLETNQPVDGVIGVDLSFVKALIAASGSVFVPSYKETVTADNFFLLTEDHAEKNFFPGSTQKKRFSGKSFRCITRESCNRKYQIRSALIEYCTCC